MRHVYSIFGSCTGIHLKFGKLEIFAIKRLSQLCIDQDSYNPEGSGKGMLYLDGPWSDALPSDPELISSIFGHILDAAYYGALPRNYDIKHCINHLINAANLSTVNYL